MLERRNKLQNNNFYKAQFINKSMRSEAQEPEISASFEGSIDQAKRRLKSGLEFVGGAVILCIGLPLVVEGIYQAGLTMYNYFVK